MKRHPTWQYYLEDPEHDLSTLKKGCSENGLVGYRFICFYDSWNEFQGKMFDFIRNVMGLAQVCARSSSK
jgi:hypothetical protein